MLESSAMAVSSTVNSIAASVGTLWSTGVATIGLIPTVFFSVAATVGVYVTLKWLWKKAKKAWTNRGAQVTQVPAHAEVTVSNP